MAKVYAEIDAALRTWIEEQRLWFVATAPLDAVGEFVQERDLLQLYADKKGAEGMAAYRVEKNSQSIDGLPGL